MFDVSCSHRQYAVSTTVAMNINQITLSAAELLSVPCEHHFATIRPHYHMPTLLQYCQLQSDVMVESLKQMTTTAFKYFTGTASYYPKPELQALGVHITNRDVKVTKDELSETERKLMQSWRKYFCAVGYYQNIHMRSEV